MAAFAAVAELARNERLKKALYRHSTFSLDGLSERIFGLAFSGLVYPQIWEDPDVDMAAMDLGEDHRIVTIASGGCNVLAYLTRNPASIDAVDLNPAHVALNRLKHAALKHLPSHADVARFFGSSDCTVNSAAYDRFIARHLDAATRRYWETRDWRGRRRITAFDRNIYRSGLLGRFIATGHCIARLHGVDPGRIMQATSLRAQRRFFDREIAPLFDKPMIRLVTRRRASLFGLGIPPAQYAELAGDAPDSLAAVLRHRLEKLACHFPLKDNYFAWQAFARRYPDPGEAALPAYLEPANHTRIRTALERVHVHHASFTELLAAKPAGSVDRYVLLDAQDWMDDTRLGALWSEIDRTASPGARVVFRTAADRDILASRLSPSILSRWSYRAEQSREYTRADRSAIYGAFHLYEKTA